MTARPFKSLLHRLRSASQKRKSAGFTLIELLIGMVIASLITSGLMYLVVQLLKTNQTESVQTQTQQEMQSALNFISSELREAVFVYDGECLQGNALPQTAPNYCPGIVNHIIPNPNNSVPILAFWKLDPLPVNLNTQCQQATTPPAGVPCDAGRTYTLVVYYLRKNQASDTEKWLGKARITRYELTQYTSNGTPVIGYVTPEQAGVGFRIWPFRRNPGGSLSLLQTTNPTGEPVTLVDFVDDTTGQNNSDSTVSCPTNYPITPTTAPFSGVRSFYACVRNNVGFNQDVFVFLRGNASGKAGNSNVNFLPTLQTQVLSRGVVDKVPYQL